MRPASPRPNLRYEIELPDGGKVSNEWKWEEPRFLEAKKENKIHFRQDDSGKWQVEYKMYLNTSKRVPRSLLTKVERNSQGKVQLRQILGENEVLNNPKPVG